MKILEKQKGITLIALVITIIVMLILVGVTITVAIKGELITKSQKAKDETTIEAEKEKIIMSAIASIDENGKFNIDLLEENLPEGYIYDDTEKSVTTNNDNVFYVTNKGEILNFKPNPWILKGLNSNYKFDVWYTTDGEKGMPFKLNSDGGANIVIDNPASVTLEQVNEFMEINDKEIKIYYLESKENYILLNLNVSTGKVEYSIYNTEDGLWEPGWTMSVK